MKMSNLRKLVLQNFKKLHRTRIRVFEGDTKALIAARHKINEEFKKNKHIADTTSINAMIKFGEDVETELRTQVIQAREIQPGVFEAKITEDTLKLDNISYNGQDVSKDVSGSQPCCQDKSQTK